MQKEHYFVADATSFSKTFCFCNTYQVHVMMLDRVWVTSLLPKENAVEPARLKAEELRAQPVL